MREASGPIILASASPRRKLMLEQAGIHVQVMPPDVDDGMLQRGKVTPEQWVMALAYFKARRVSDQLRHVTGQSSLWWNPTRFGIPGTVLGADTVCVAGESILGQPRDAAHARSMLMMLRNAEHPTITGVCLFSLASGARCMFVDRTVVRVGTISDRQVDDYLASGDWRGKAGAYNLAERIAAGWPIEVVGDPATVMGLPMRRLSRMLV